MKGLSKLRQQTPLYFSLKNFIKKPARMSSSFNYFDSHGLLPKDGFSFQVGAPNPTSLKAIAGFMEKSTETLKCFDGYEQSLQYGCDTGYGPVREQVANFLTRGYGDDVNKDSLYMTCGASAGLQMVLTHFFSNDHTMFVEDPSYLLVPSFLKNGFYVKGDSVPLEGDGMNLDILEEKVKKLSDVKVSARHPFRAAVYVIPVYHNPTGICYSAAKCERLVTLARKYNLLVIADDIYNLLPYKKVVGSTDEFEKPPARLYSYDKKSDPTYMGNVISNGTFSKIAAPGLRVGWMEAPRRVIDHINSMSYLPISGGGMSYYVSRILAGVLQTENLDKHIEGLKIKHEKRMSTFISIVEDSLSKYGVTISHPDGGYFLWVKLPTGVTGDEVLEFAKTSENVTFVPGVKTSLNGNFENYIRLSIAYYEADEIAIGAKSFCRAVEYSIKKSCNL